MCRPWQPEAEMTLQKQNSTTKRSSIASIKDGLSESIKRMSIQMEDVSERRRYGALLVCMISIIFDVLLAVSAFVCAAVTDSSAGYAFALDCILDALAAGLVLWRFYGSNSDAKEAFACVALGILFCLAGAGVLIKSSYDLYSKIIPQKMVYVFIIAGVGGVVNSVLGVAKYLLGRRIGSQCLILEALNTGLSAFLALMLAVSDVVYFYHESAWTIDPVTSILVALILLACGIKVLCTNRKRNTEISPLLQQGKV